MANVKFGVNEQKVAAAAPVEAPPADTTAPETASQLPATRANFALGDFVPSFDDIVLPRLNLVQNVGLLKDNFIPGSVLYNQQAALFVPADVDKQTGNVRRKATPPVTLTVLGFRPTRYAEKVAGGARGAIVNTEEEVRKAGGTLDYKEWELKKDSGMKRFEPLADALIAIQRPEAFADDDTIFIYPINGQKYALALWALRGVAYTAAAKRVFFTQRSIGCLRSGYPSYAFYVSARSETRGQNSYWVPVAATGAKNTPEFLEFATKVLGGDITPANAPDTAAEAE